MNDVIDLRCDKFLNKRTKAELVFFVKTLHIAFDINVKEYSDSIKEFLNRGVSDINDPSNLAREYIEAHAEICGVKIKKGESDEDLKKRILRKHKRKIKIK